MFELFIYQNPTKHCLAGCQIDIGENENKLFNRNEFLSFQMENCIMIYWSCVLRSSIKFICAVASLYTYRKYIFRALNCIIGIQIDLTENDYY